MTVVIKRILVAFALHFLLLAMQAQTGGAPMLQTLGGAGAVDIGQRVVLTPIFVGNPPVTPLRYQWRKNGSDVAGATTGNFTIASVTSDDAGTYGVAVSNDAGTSVTSGELTVRPLSAITFTLQPSSRVVQVGQSVTFAVIAIGTFPRTFQWRKDGADIPGATTTLLALSGVTAASAGTYTIVGTNPVGVTVSSPASLTVNAATPLVLFPTSPPDATYIQGQGGQLSLSISAGSQPITYQWLKNGTAIPGATNSSFTFAPVALGDAGRYAIVVTNVLGSVTSREATVTVTPATAITISSQPVAQSVFQGQEARFSVAHGTGTQPITYQWLKDGSPLPDATTSALGFRAVTLADAGNYSVVLTNPAGPVTSNAVPLTVTPAVLPGIMRQPVGATVPYFGDFYLNAEVTGTPPLNFEWKKDGQPVYAGGPSLSYSNVTPAAHSGSYVLTVTNAAGSASTEPVTVTVSAPIRPVITRQPESMQVAAGMSASFSVQFSALGAGRVTLQWLKDGRPIPGADSISRPVNANSYYIPFVQDTDTGDYAVVLTGPAGSVTSATAKLTVLSATPPAVAFWPNDEFRAVGENTQLNLNFVTGSPPLIYQWYKDGAALPRGTSSTLYITPVTEADFGTYTATISNGGGLISSPPIRLRPYASTPPPWKAAEQFGNIVYFLATSPHRIERYDLTAEQWLPATLLTDPRTPAAMLPAAEGVYLTYERSLVRRSLDLTTETPIINAASDIVSLFIVDRFLYYTAYVNRAVLGTVYTTASVRRTDLQPGPILAPPVHYAIFAPGKRLTFGTYDDGLSPRVFPCDAEGRLGAATASSFSDQFPTGSRVVLFPGEELVANGAGTIYRLNNLSYAGSLGDRPNDLTFLADGTPVVIRGRTVQSIDATTFRETGTASLPFAGWRGFSLSGNVFIFGAAASTSGSYQVAKLSGSALTKPALATPAIGASERYSVDGAFLGADGVVGILTRSRQALLRWSTSTRSFLSPVPLRATPFLAAQNPGATRVLLAHADGQISEVPLRAGDVAERQLGTLGVRVESLTDLGDMIALTTGGGGYYTPGSRLVLDALGRPIHISAPLPFNHPTKTWRAGSAWDVARRRLYAAEFVTIDTDRLSYEVVPANGVLPATPAAVVTGVGAPYRFSPDGGFVATGNGRVFNADLTPQGVLANNILDAAWLPGDFHTIRSFGGGTQLQRWSRTNYVQTGTLSIPGTPVRMFRISDTQLLVVTNSLGYATFTIVNADLSVAVPPTIPPQPDLAGAYFASIRSNVGGSDAGDVALHIRADRTAVLLIQSGGAGSMLATNFTVNSDGSFIVTAVNAFFSSITRVISGSVSPDGSFSGSIAGTGSSFSGAKATGAAAAAGLYRAPAIDGAAGEAYTIVGGDGRAIVLVRHSVTSVAGMSNVGSTGRFTIAFSNGVSLSVAIDAETGRFTATGDLAILKGTVFAGLRDGFSRTDRLANISTRGQAGAGEEAMIAGFVISGSGSRPVLLRAIGPALAEFGVTGTLADPKLALFRGPTQVMESNDWSSEINASSIAAASTRLGAFGLPSPGKDAVLLATLEPGSYTAQVSAATGSGGVSLVEVYDAGQAGDAGPRLVNIATRGRVGTGDEVLIAGIVVSGNAPKTVLVRAIGPGLGSLGVSGALSDPVLTILAGNSVLATNDDWSSSGNTLPTAEITQAMNTVGAFPLVMGSRDAAVFLTLRPGNYTAKVTGKNSATGIALVEVYELNN